ncbi:hypothetical protein FNV43_RR01901 [Rhamnella rubrinervis]|uniref:ADP-ribosyl cyclase/cyclic ADP-ribose hydrolase n=1 Tax=Rhamnella rubrinervis TaxID=2594499 RepID=A0A8K0HT58_9ROSA|nr:hypothetical protein FNV43_RR01901 [Rhamnella rubrinervis]
MFIGGIAILYTVYKYISDGACRREPRRSERLLSLDAASSSSSNPPDDYELFLSFRGETGKTFTSHLYKALDLKGIYTFVDVKRLERGEDISTGLDNAIEGSRCAVVILSGNYASSRWCMDELVQILQCRKDSNIKQIVVPIFYHVNPDDILKDKGTIWEGFQSLKQEFRHNQEKVKSWRDALIQLASIAGHHVHDGTNEATFIEDFIKVVSSKLFDAALLNIPKDLVGMDSRLERLKLCVSRSSFGDVCFIGICGLGGLGKTTLAEAYLKHMSCQFQAISFLANIREVCEKWNGDGIVKLQKQLLTDVLKGEHTVNNVSEGKGIISRRLRGKKILVVLDDVDQLNQLEGLAEENNWFGDGSQIIVTTRDESLLKRLQRAVCESDRICKWLAISSSSIGFLFTGKTRDEWKSALDRLKEYPEKAIMRVLRISFDGLEETVQNIFLDIACFFNGESLVDKSLLHMDHDRNILRMHDLLEEMGMEIVREKSRNESGRRSRIWLGRFFHVLTNETGTEEVEAIVCPDYMELEKISTLRGFSNLKKLRLLNISTRGWSDPCLETEYLPNELRFLKWEGFPLKSFPQSFQPRELLLYNLKSIDLRESSEIRKLEDFSLFPNLEKLILDYCCYLKEIDPSITVLKRLTSLSLIDCESLKSLPTSMGGLKSLKFLNLTGCSSLGDLPEGFVGSDEELDVPGHELQSHGWKNIWNTIAGLSCLEELYLGCCGLRDGAFPDDFGCLVSLEYLDLSCNKFSTLPAHFNRLSKLRDLDLSFCGNLTSLGPELPDSLESIRVDGCRELHTFLDPLSQCNFHCSAIYCVDCFKLVNRQGSERTAITSLGRYLQNPPKLSKRFDIVLPGNEIPSWFTHKAIGSSSISLPLHPNWCTNKWMGFALSLCFRSTSNLYWRDWFWEIKINQEDWGFGHVYFPVNEYSGTKRRIWLLYLPCNTYFHSEWHDKKFDHVQFSFKYRGEGVFEEDEVFAQCGIRLVYEGDVQELELDEDLDEDESIELPAEDEDDDDW